MPVPNNVWNKLNPWSDYDCDLDILDSYTMGQLLLEMECNTPDHSQINIKRQAVSEMKKKLEVALEIIDAIAPVLEVYLAEQATPYEDNPDLYMVDEYGIASMRIKKIPYGSSGGNILVSYQSYVRVMDERHGEDFIPAWGELQDYFVNGEIV